MKSAELRLPYYKQGDDLAHWLEKLEDPVASLRAHAEQMDAAASVLRQASNAIAGHQVEVHADTHVIQISGPDELIDRLVESGVLEVWSGDEWIEESDGEEWDDYF